MTNKNIYYSLCGLDPELVMRAAPTKNMQKKKKYAWAKQALLAACLCLMVMASLTCLIVMVRITFPVSNDPPDIPIITDVMYPEYSEASLLHYKGDTFENEFTTIAHQGFSKNSITLLIDKKNNDPFRVAFRGWKSDGSGVVNSSFSDLTIYVNGEKVDVIPATPGIYEVIIDYSKFASKCDKLDPYMFVMDAGYFCLNAEGYNISGDIDYSDLTLQG